MRISTKGDMQIAGQYGPIKESACIGAEDPDGRMGQIPILFVVPKNSGYTDAGLQVFLASQMERYKLPKHYVLLQELPRNQMER